MPLFAFKNSDGSYIDFRTLPDIPMDELAAAIAGASAELSENVEVNTEVSSTTNFIRLDKANNLYLVGLDYNKKDIEAIVSAVAQTYQDNRSKIQFITCNCFPFCLSITVFSRTFSCEQQT